MHLATAARFAAVAALAASFAAACSGSPVEPRAAAAPSRARVASSGDSAGVKVQTSDVTAMEGPSMPWNRGR